MNDFSRRRIARRMTLVSMVLCGVFVIFGVSYAADSAYSADSSAAAVPMPVPWPATVNPVQRNPRIEERIADVLAHMTLEQKVAQMVQADIRFVTPEDVKVYRLGSILNGGGAFPGNDKHADISNWVSLADRFYDASMDTSGGAQAIPIIWGTDAVHGHNNVMGATIFPHNIGLGAAHDPDLVRRIGAATAREVAATGIDWTFAPTVAVVRDARWGRAYEGYSQRPELVRALAGAMVQGLQGVVGTPGFLDADHIVATAKHFIGDGGTGQGIDRGDNPASEQELFDIHGQGYIAAVAAGVQTVMASYNSWRGEKMHAQHHLLTEVLKTRMGFDGLVVSDWDGIDEVQGCSKDHCSQAINAGIDLFMVPDQWRTFIQNTVAQVRAGDIPESRINDAVSRILRVKLRAGLFEKGRPSSRPLANARALLGAPEHRAVAREAVRKSLVLLKNARSLLPLHRNLHVLVAGAGADDIGRQSGGWTLSWQGTGNSNADFPGATSIFAGIRAAVAAGGGTAELSTDGSFRVRPDVAIVVFGEDPYAEWHGDIRSLDYRGPDPVDIARPAPEVPPPGAWRQSSVASLKSAASGRDDVVAEDASSALILSFRRRGIPVVAVFLSGRPRGVTPELEASNAFVAAWLPGSEGEGIADVLFRSMRGTVNFDFTGRLSFDWPRTEAQDGADPGGVHRAPLFPYGFGLTYCNQHCDAPLSRKPWRTQPSSTSRNMPMSP